MRNWPATLQGASFRGFPFHVEREGVDGAGRRVAVHPFVKAEVTGTEDMGRKLRRFRLAAYIVGDDADAQARAFTEVCSAPGAAMLVLPMLGGELARCIGCSMSADKDKLGRIAFDLEFIDAGADGGGFPAIPLGDRIAQGALDTLSGLVSTVIGALPF